MVQIATTIDCKRLLRMWSLCELTHPNSKKSSWWSTIFTLFSSHYLSTVVGFGGNIVLARLLTPDDFGIYTLANSIFILVFMFAGFGSQESIIQNRDVPLDKLVPTAYWSSLGIALSFSSIAAMTAWIVRDIYSASVPGIVVMLSCVAFFRSLGEVYGSLLIRRMEFRGLAIFDLIANLLSVSLAIMVAVVFEIGMWALVVRDAVAVFIKVFANIYLAKYSVKFVFDLPAASAIWKFGWKLMVNRISEVVYGYVDNLVIGAVWGSVMVGYYGFAYRLGFLGYQFIQAAMQPLLLSVSAELQHTTDKLKIVVDTLFYWLFRAAGLCMLLVIFLGKDMVVLIYGSTWATSGTLFQSMALFLGILPIHEAVRFILLGSGHIDRVIQSRFIMLAFYTVMLVFSVALGDIMIVVVAITLSLLLSTCLMFYQLGKIIRISWSFLLCNTFTVLGVTWGAMWLLVPLITSNSLVYRIVMLGLATCLVYIGMLIVLENAVIERQVKQILALRHRHQGEAV